MIAVVLVALFSTAMAACSGSTCAACLAGGADCIYCDGGAFGLCQDKTMVGMDKCNVGTDVGATCPDKCANNTVTADQCKLAADWKTQSLTSCNAVNKKPEAQSTTTSSTTAAPVECDKCCMAYKTDTDCAQAMADFSCTNFCQKCSDGGLIGQKVCKKNCDDTKAKCPTVLKDCMGIDAAFGPSICSDADTGCAGDAIAHVAVASAAPAGTTAAPAGTTVAGGTTAAATPAATLGTVKAGDCNATLAQKSCFACATAGCQFCSTGMTSETAGTLLSCVAKGVACGDAAADKLATKTTDPKQCSYDLNGLCEPHKDCKTCTGDSTNGCVWCDTAGAATGGLTSSGSCNAGPKCKNPAISPTAADKCSASSIAIAFFAAVAAVLAAL